MLATLSELKSYLDISTPDDDIRLTGLLSAADSQVKQYISHDPEGGSAVDRTDGNGKSYMMPREYPLLSVTSLSISGVVVPAEVLPNVLGWYIFDGVVMLSEGLKYTKGTGNVILSYDYGYSAIPGALKQAVIELAGLRFREIPRLGVSSKSLAGESITYSNKGMPDSIAGYIDQFRKLFA